MKRIFSLVAVICCASMGNLTSAGVMNGGFESAGGSFTDWSTLGTTSIEDASFGSGPTEGSYQALLETVDSDNGETTASIETFLGLSAGTLDAISPSGPGITDGSAIRQTVMVGAGDVLSFDWNFLTDETTAGGVDDFAFYSITDGTGAVLIESVESAIASSAFGSSATVFVDETGFATTSVSFASAGTFELGFGIVDFSDDIVNSGLLLDNVAISSAPTGVVPEPASLAIFVIGFCPLCGLRRRRS